MNKLWWRIVRPGAAVILTVGCALAGDVGAEFYSWHDDQGRKHVSNIPAHGFTGDGDIAGAYDPNSIVYQYARMLDTLAAQGSAIADVRERKRRGSEITRRGRQTPVVGHAPREGMMNLDELIALEKRGGSSLQ